MSEFSKKDRLLWSLVNRDTKVLKNRPPEALHKKPAVQGDSGDESYQQYKPDYKRREKQQIRDACVIRDCAAALASAVAAKKMAQSQNIRLFSKPSESGILEERKAEIPAKPGALGAAAPEHRSGAYSDVRDPHLQKPKGLLQEPGIRAPDQDRVPAKTQTLWDVSTHQKTDYEELRKKSIDRNFGVHVFQRKKLKKQAIVASLDLHGCSRAQAECAVQDFLYKNYMIGNQWVRIITGKSGVLHSYTPELLRKYANFASGYTYARHDDGGAGALYVRIRRRETPSA
jgi:DNA-nicking Smr family endonuclease